MIKKSYLLVTLVLLLSTTASAIDFSAHGYYRLRFEFTHDLDLQRPNPGIVPQDEENDSNDRFGTIAFAQQRFRLNPTLKLNDNISIHGQIDFLDNLLFGQSDVVGLEFANPITGTLDLPAANAPFGVVGSVGGDSAVGSGGGNINVRRLYVDIMTAGGKFRIGRQPSHFGLGILTNDGDDQDADYGDTFDRILYMGGLPMGKGGQLNFGLAFDFGYNAQLDPSIDGLDEAIAPIKTDAIQTGVFLLYQRENFEVGTFTALRYRNGDEGAYTTTATYVDVDDEDGDSLDYDGIEKPAGKDGDTLLYIIDLYGRIHFNRNYSAGFEAVYIGGKIATGIAVDAIILDDDSQETYRNSNPLADPIELPLIGTQNDISVFMAAVELDAQWDFGGEAHLKAGYASGDGEPLSSKITQLGFRPDYDIALMMFDVPLGTSPAIRVNGITEQGRKPITPNYINNAAYLSLEYKHAIDISSGVPWATDFKLGGKVVTAFAPADVINLNFSEISGLDGLPHVLNRSRWYGLEIDLSVEMTLFDFMHWKTVAGVLLPGGAYDIKNDASEGYPAVEGVDNILFDNADPAFAVKSMLVFEF